MNKKPEHNEDSIAIPPLAALPLSTSSPAEILRLLFSYPYINIVPQLFTRTREYELGLEFVYKSRDILLIYAHDIPEKEAGIIEKTLTFLELSFLDALNRWNDYLFLFEKYFQEKRTKYYILKYKTDKGEQADIQRFGRYLLLYSYNGIADVHSFYGIEFRRAIIERKQFRLESGKSVEHLKRHQKNRLSFEERERRYNDLMRLLKWIRKASADG